MLLQYYLEKLDYTNIPTFLIKYLNTPSLLRLKNVGYFCGMDYASKDIYNFSEFITRYDHSISVSLMVYKLTRNKVKTLAALFHDIATPCFSHVIDYMNKDYEKQESTEEYTEYILNRDSYLKKCLKEDNIDLNEIINFKKYSVVDNERPRLCADRIDGIILTGIGWTKNINKCDIENIIKDLYILKNEDNEDELGFNTLNIAKRVLEINKNIDIYCHSKEDNYMMQLLARITKLAIDKNIISYEDLWKYQENEIFTIFEKTNDKTLQYLLYEFKNIKKENIPNIELPNIKIRKLSPLVNGKRITF